MADTAQPTSSGADELTFASSNIEYPLAPEGVHKVKVTRATFSLRDNKFKPDAPKKPTASLMLQSDQSYTDEASGETKPYNLFSMMTISDHPKSGLFSFFKDVMGIEIPLNEKKQIAIKSNKEVVQDGEPRIHLPQFENLEFSVVVKHFQKEDGTTKDGVDSMFASPEQKALNAQLFRS